jgi:nucleoside-diphosphate-sugar epimerase
MKKYSVKKIIYSSSAAVYGEPKKELIDEKHETNPNSQYGVSKLAAEKLVEAYKHLYNIDFVILRYFNIFGINQRYDYYGNVIPIFVNKILNNLPIKIYGDGLQTRDFINVFDIAKINYLAAINNKVSNRIINVGTDQEISIISLASKIYSILKKDKDIIYSESRIGDVRNCRANNFNLREKLGVNKFVDFDFGLREYIDWYIREEFPK